jgi:hypothetical protein
MPISEPVATFGKAFLRKNYRTHRTASDCGHKTRQLLEAVSTPLILNRLISDFWGSENSLRLAMLGFQKLKGGNG